MFERFTADAQHVVVVAQEVARTQGYSQICLGHLRAAVAGEELSDGQPPEASVLERLGLSDVDQRMVEPPPPIPFDDEVKRVLVDALERAGDGSVGLTHLQQALAV
ncbi:MAG TPA: hypothetical protein VM093_01565 [Aeromicrobium sp.]|nr:hypothetical protein [Aeromicrobium sp.]